MTKQCKTLNQNPINKFSHIQINTNATLLEAISKIETNKIKSCFVADKDGKIIGVLVDGDIRRWLLKNPDKSPNQEIIAKHFSFKKFVYIFQNDFTFNNLCSLFNDEKIDIIPILNENKTLFNFITRVDFHFLLLNNIALKPNLTLHQKKNNLSISSRPWGFYKSLLFTKNVQSKLITLFPHQMISLQKHKRREEHWIVVYGKGKIILEDSIMKAYTGKYVFIPKGCKHRIINTSANQNLIFCEVQLGDYFGEDDIIRYEDKYNRR